MRELLELEVGGPHVRRVPLRGRNRVAGFSIGCLSTNCRLQLRSSSTYTCGCPRSA